MTILRRVVGAEFDGTVLHYVFGRTMIPLLSASYGDSLAPEKISDMGSQTIDAMTLGKYDTTEGTIKMRSSVYRSDLLGNLPQNGFGNLGLPIVILMDHPDLGSDSDLLQGARLIAPSAPHENSSKPEEVELKIVYRQVYWTDRRVTINRVDPNRIPLQGIIPPGFTL